MKIIATKENLASAMRKASSAVTNRPIIPVINNVLISAKGDRVTFSSTDNELFLVTWIPALVEEEGMTTLPARKLQQIIAALPSGDVTIESNEEDVSTLICQKSFYKIHGLPAIDFPNAESDEYDCSFEMKISDIVRSLAKVSYAKSLDEARKQLNGVVLSIRSGTITAAATDGKRLALVESILTDEGVADGDFILPSRASIELPKCLDGDGENVIVKLSRNSASFESQTINLTTKLVEGVYPNFRQVIPENCGNTVSIQRAPFMNALNRVALMVMDSGGSVKLTFAENQLQMFSSSVDTGESSESLEVPYEGEEISVSFNPQYFIEPLKVMDSDVIAIEFGKKFSPLKLSGDEGFLYMLMPMRG